MKYSSLEVSKINGLSQSNEKTPSDFWLTARNNLKLKNQAPPIEPISRNQNLPLSFNQERLWLLEQLQPNTSIYNLLHCFHLKGVVNVEVLEQSLIEITRRHEILRTIFSMVDGKPVQIICPKIDLKLPVVDVRELPTEQRETEIQRLALEDAEQPFDLVKGPLWRFKLLRLNEDEHVLFRTIHHIIFDGWSHSVFMRELGILYEAFSAGQSSPLPELPVQYADYAQTHRHWLQGEVFSSQLDYWQQQLSGHVSALELPTDYSRSFMPSYQGAYQPLELSENLTQALKKLSFQQGVSLFVTLLTAFKTLLYLYTEQEDMIVCSPVAGRHRVEAKALIGYFNNVVAMRTDLSGNPSFRELLGRVSQVSLGAFAHQDIPLQKVAELPSLVRTPLTRAMFILQNIPNQSLELDNLTVNSLYVDREIANFDLSLSMQEKAGKLTGGAQYKTDLFKAASITQMLEHFQSLLASLVANPDLCLSDLPLLTKEKPRQLLNQTDGSAEFVQDEQVAFVAPRNELERQLTKIWEQVLGIQPIGVKDNFFELGGHSLAGVCLVTEINKVFNKNVDLTILFQTPTIEQLANILRQSKLSTPSSSLVPIQPKGSKSPLFAIHILGKGLEPFRTLARYLGSDQPTLGLVNGLGAHIEDRKHIPFTRVEDLAAHYIQEMRTVQPEGPYLLAGLSFGGIVAYEMARQLHAQSQEVALLALFDTHPIIPTKFLDSSLFQIHLRNLLQMRLEEKFAYILEKVRGKIQENIPGWIKRGFLKMRAEFYSRTGHPMPYALYLSLHIDSNMKLAQGYVSQVYPGRVTLFRANEQSVKYEHSPSLGWSDLATGGVDIYEVPGDHLSIFEEPNNRVLAEKLKACLDKVQAEISEDSISNLLIGESETTE